jgi:hypothetical protein
MILELMEDWLGCVWECRCGILSKPWSMLAIDAFHGHPSSTLRARLRNRNSDRMIIPSSMTSYLQLLEITSCP